MTRQDLFEWVRKEYGTEPEYPWHDRNAVLRRKDNGKWYGVVLEVSDDKLGPPEKDFVDVLNVKRSDVDCFAAGTDGLFPGVSHEQREVDQRPTGTSGSGRFHPEFAGTEFRTDGTEAKEIADRGEFRWAYSM